MTRPFDLFAALTLLSGIAAAQDGPTITLHVQHGVIGPAIPAQKDAPDVPPPPRAAFLTPPKGHTPDVPVGRPTWDVPQGPPLVPGQGSASPAVAPVQVYRSSVIRPAGASWATVGEPSVSKLTNVNGFLHTGNWYAANSTNGGASWNYLNPYTLFGAVDGGFCCDQATIAHQGSAITLWLLQYGYSATNARGSVMLGVGPDTAGASHGYRFDPTIAGFPSGTWFDFPHLAVSNLHVFITSNVFNASSQYVGSAVIRVLASELRTGGNLGVGSIRSDSATPPASQFGSARFALGIDGQTPVMHWASQASTTSLRIFSWPDNGAATSRDRAIGTWYVGTTPAPGPDARDWTARMDNRIQGGFRGAQGTVGWAWTSNAGGPYPLNFTRIVRFDSNYALTDEASYWNPTIAYAYMSLAPNPAGHIGATIVGGGGNFYPHTLCVIMDDLDGFAGGDNNYGVAGDSGPATSIWGDYTWSQSIGGNKWVGTGQAQVGGTANANSEHRNFDFGRGDLTTPVTRQLTLQSTPVAGAAFTLNVGDYNLLGRGTTNAARTFRSGTPVQVTAAATLGARQFYRWLVNGVPQTIGQATASVTMSAAMTVVAQYGVHTTGTFASFGAGCPGTNGIPSMTTSATPPELGLQPAWSLTNGPRGGVVLLVLGASRTSWNGIPLPLRLPGTTCDLLVDMVLQSAYATNAAGQTVAMLTLPNDASLLGGRVHTQWWCIDIGANPQNISTSNAVTATIGGWNLN